jgi:Ala-tRNA(Pro) deacylase
MPVKALKELLDNQHVKYVCLQHSRAYTAQEVAEAAHVSGKLVAKTIIVKLDGKFAMVVLPALDHINFEALKTTSGAKVVDLASEAEFKGLFPGCDAGAMPPFGSLYDMPVYASSRLSQHDHIIFSAGTHIELVQMTYVDFERLAKPKMIATVDKS